MRFVLKIWNDHINGKMMVDVLRFVPLVGSKFLVFLLNCAVCVWATINTSSILSISFREAFCPVLLLLSTAPLPVPYWWWLMYATILTMHTETLLWSSPVFRSTGYQSNIHRINSTTTRFCHMNYNEWIRFFFISTWTAQQIYNTFL